MKKFSGNFLFPLLYVCIFSLGACNLKELAENGEIDYFGADYQDRCNAEKPYNRLDDGMTQESILFSVEEQSAAEELVSVLKACDAVNEDTVQEFIRQSEFSGRHWYRVNLNYGVKAQNYVATLVYYPGVSSLEKEIYFGIAPEQDTLFSIQPIEPGVREPSFGIQESDIQEREVNSRE